MRIVIEVIDASGVDERRASLDAVDDVAFVEKEFGEIGPVLPRDAGDKRNLG